MRKLSEFEINLTEKLRKLEENFQVVRKFEGNVLRKFKVHNFHGKIFKKNEKNNFQRT